MTDARAKQKLTDKNGEKAGIPCRVLLHLHLLFLLLLRIVSCRKIVSIMLPSTMHAQHRAPSPSVLRSLRHKHARNVMLCFVFFLSFSPVRLHKMCLCIQLLFVFVDC
jgi:hypothetical protein